jgi:hypothetical protein
VRRRITGDNLCKKCLGQGRAKPAQNELVLAMPIEVSGINLRVASSVKHSRIGRGLIEILV